MLMINFLCLVVNKSNFLCNCKNLIITTLILTLILMCNSFSVESIFLFNYNFVYNGNYILLYLIIVYLSILLISELNISNKSINFVLLNLFAISLIYICKNNFYVILSLELVTISLIGLYFSKSRIRATIFYFFLSSLATCLLCIGFLFDLNNIPEYYIFIIIGLLIKLSVAPLHQYAPYLYLKESSQLNCVDKGFGSIYFLYSISKSQLILLLNYKFLPYLGIVNLIVGIYNGFKNYNIIFLMFVFSSISHIGYMLLSNELNICLYYLIQNIITSFIIILLINKITKNYNNNLYTLNLTGLNFFSSILFIFSILSLLGIPPLIGFMGKLLIVENVIENKGWLFSIIIIIMSCFSTSYYLYSIKLISNSLNSEIIVNSDSSLLKLIQSFISLLIFYIFVDKFIDIINII